MKKVQTCESLVLTGTDWVSLRYHHILEDTAEVMIEDFSGITNPVFAECMFDGVSRRIFVAGRDYELDGLHGRIRRTPHSAIRDYTENVFYGQETFNHEPYNGRWGSYPFMVYISYIYEDGYNQRVGG